MIKHLKRIYWRIRDRFFPGKDTHLDLILPLMETGTRAERRAMAKRLGFSWDEYKGLEYQAAKMLEAAAKKGGFIA